MRTRALSPDNRRHMAAWSSFPAVALTALVTSSETSSSVLAAKPFNPDRKTRRVATLDDCSLCVDDVEGIGGFLELEHLAPDDADTHTVQAGLAAFVSSLGIAATRTDQTYDSLVHAA